MTPRRSLAFQTVVLIITVTTLLLVAFGAVAGWLYHARGVSTLRVSLLEMADQMEIALPPAIWNIDDQQVTKIVDSMMRNKQLGSIVVTTSNGVFARGRNELWEAVPLEPGAPLVGTIAAQRELYFKGEKLGTLALTATTRFLDEEMVHAEYLAAGLIAFLDVLLIGCIYWIYSRTILRPLKRLEKYATAVSRGEIPEVLQSEMYFSGEMEVLRVSLAKMIEQLDSRYKDLLREAERTKGKEVFIRTLVDTIPDLVWLKDSEGVYLMCNRIFEQFIGARETGLIGKTDYDFVDAELADFFRHNDRRAIAAGVPSFNEEWVTFASDGRRVLLHVTKTPMRDAEGAFVGVLGIGRDITQRKRDEEELRKNSEVLNTVLDNLGANVFLKDAACRYTYVNRKVSELFGLPPEEILGKDDSAFFSLDSLGEIRRSDQLVLEEGEVVTREERVQVLDGAAHYTFLTVKLPLRDHEGNIYALCGISTDISKVKELEAEKETLRNQLFQAQKLEAIGTLAGGIAHDFNNILSAILGYSQLTQQGLPADSEEFENIEEILLAANRAKELVKQILAFSRKREESRVLVEMHLVVGEALRLIRSVIPTTIRIVQDIRKERDSVLADPTQIHQVVMNLCTNSYHAMRITGGTLEVTMVHVDVDEALAWKIQDLKAGPYVKLVVADDGEGMSPETLSRVFEPFYTTKSQGEGTGMGMAVVHGIVKSLGGAIDIESYLGKGTTIAVYIPRYSGQQVDAAGFPLTTPGGNEKVLVVDDEVGLAKMMRKMLESLGYVVAAVHSAAEALALIKEDPWRFDLVVTDQTMPEISGAELIVEMLKIRPNLPVLLCTGYSAIINEENARKLGAQALLRKPLTKELLGREVRAALDSRGRRAS